VDVILIPGFWLDGSSWDGVAPALEQAGHRVRTLTLPGRESADTDRTGIGLRDQVAAVVAAVDAADGPVVLVGHSGGAAVAHAATDARPDRVARQVHVDDGPLGDGQSINDSLPVVDGEIPLPDWAAFSEQELRDLDDDLRESFRARAVPEPAAVASDPQVLSDDRRYDVPLTIIACAFSREQLQEWMAQGEPSLAELAGMRDVEFVELPTGHWPQFTRPNELGQAILAAIDRS
jgi:pimeloyl-ACP methyl ester carboxylesterase